MDVIRQLEDSGASTVVLFSLFEEQIRPEIAAREYFVTRGTDSCSEALSYLPDIGTYDVGPGQLVLPFILTATHRGSETGEYRE